MTNIIHTNTLRDYKPMSLESLVRKVLTKHLIPYLPSLITNETRGQLLLQDATSCSASSWQADVYELKESYGVWTQINNHPPKFQAYSSLLDVWIALSEGAFHDGNAATTLLMNFPKHMPHKILYGRQIADLQSCRDHPELPRILQGIAEFGIVKYRDVLYPVE